MPSTRPDPSLRLRSAVTCALDPRFAYIFTEDGQLAAPASYAFAA